MADIEIQLQLYEETTGLEREILNCMIIQFSGLTRWVLSSELTHCGVRPVSEGTALKTIKALINVDLVEDRYDRFVVDPELCLRLIPDLLQQPEYQQMARNIQIHEQYSYNPPVSAAVRNYLFVGMLGENKFSAQAVERLENKIPEAVPLFIKVIANPAYDKALWWSPAFFFRVLAVIHVMNILNFWDFRIFTDFLSRQKQSQDLALRLNSSLLEIAFHSGKTSIDLDLLRRDPTDQPLILRSQVELFRGNFAASAAAFEEARLVGLPDDRGPGMVFHTFFEFLYWLNFVFWPDGLNLKKLDAAIKRNNKQRLPEENLLLALLYFIKKDRSQAEAGIKGMAGLRFDAMHRFQQFYFMILSYLLHGHLPENLHPMTRQLAAALLKTNRQLFLREVVWMARQSGMELDAAIVAVTDWPDAPPCLMSRITSQEKWEEMLDGLINLSKVQPATSKKASGASRIGYLVDMKNCVIQPIVQTVNAKGVWSLGRSISLKRFKDLTIEGLTDQDRKFAGAITHQSGYYQASQYFIDFDRAVVELCGHPYLFSWTNQGVSIELVRTQPEMVTEQLPSGLRLKTNITESGENLVIIPETQTRYQVIKLTPQQQAIIRMIKDGITIPERGKEKLLATIAGLSGMITVHSDLITETTAAQTVEADSRIRVQVLPFGEGLRVQAFVKPLGSIPPYLKPGVGGKMVYGSNQGEKLQAVRDLAAEKSNADLLDSDIAIRLDADIFSEPVNFPDPYEVLELLDVLGNHADIAVLEWPEGEKFGIRQSAGWSNLSLRINGKGTWFELEGDLAIDETSVISLNELILMNRTSKGRFIELKPGEFLALADSFKRQLDELASTVSVSRAGIVVNRFAAHAIDEFAQKAGSWKADKKWKDFQKLFNADTASDLKIPESFDGELRPYQEEGFRWMVRLNSWGAGACLADDMGLGKTIQAIAMLLHLADKGPAVVVCPASVISNWVQELASFAPTLNPVTLRQGNRTSLFAALAPRDVLIISYGLLQTGQTEIERIKWSMAILDEAHAIKNTQTKSSKSAMTIQAGFKLVLTGTPIQNHLGELWNLFNFSNPGLLGTLAQFTDRYIRNENPAQKHHLKKLITPFILRRTKNKVLDELPPKTEITVPVHLSDPEMAFYEALRREAVATIEGGTGPLGQQHLQALAELTRLRLACCNTLLVDKNIAIPSAKLDAFLEIIDVLRANNHRALVFSQFVMHLALIRAELDRLGMGYQYLDGSTSLPDREQAVKSFQGGRGDLFLISLKAGGLGLNLTAADYVIHLDPWWNPAVEDQASDRAHRIGQSKPVTIYRLVAAHTIEDKIVRLHHTKRDLADSLLEGTDQSARLSTADLLEFIREG